MTETTAAPAFEQALEKLEEIVRKLEGGDLALEESLRLYEEGVRLSTQCHARLEDAQGRIEALVKNARGEVTDAGGRPRTRPFDPEAE